MKNYKIDNKKLKSHLLNYLKDIQKEYKKSKQVLVRDREAKQVFRGRQRAVYSVAEDLLAKRLWRIFKSKRIIIFVDQPISLKGKNKVCYPDITICKKEDQDRYIILYMLDLKMDVGWHRKSYMSHAKDLTIFCKQMKSCGQLKGKKYDIDEEQKKQIIFDICDNACYDELIVSSKNSGKPENERKLINKSHDKKTNIWVLLKGKHPNKKSGGIQPIYNDWIILITKINRIINKYIVD